MGGVFRAFPHITITSAEVKRFHVTPNDQLLCWTDWNNPKNNRDAQESGCGMPNGHEVNALSLCDALLEAVRKRPRKIVIGTYFHPSLFSHAWFRKHDALVRELYALPRQPPTPGTAIIHIRRCGTDSPHAFFIQECDRTAPHFYPTLPSQYVARVLRYYPNHTLSASVSPDCRFSPKMANLRTQFNSLAASTPDQNLPHTERIRHLKNDQTTDLNSMMRAEVFIADVGSFSAWVAYLRGLLFEGINHMPVLDYEPIRYGRVWEADFRHVPPQLVDAHHFAPLGVSAGTVYHVANRAGDAAWFLRRKGTCSPFTPATRPSEPAAGIVLPDSSYATNPSPCRPRTITPWPPKPTGR